MSRTIQSHGIQKCKLYTVSGTSQLHDVLKGWLYTVSRTIQLHDVPKGWLYTRVSWTIWFHDFHTDILNPMVIFQSKTF